MYIERIIRNTHAVFDKAVNYQLGFKRLSFFCIRLKCVNIVWLAFSPPPFMFMLLIV
jgi:hypothetical protein